MDIKTVIGIVMPLIGLMVFMLIIYFTKLLLDRNKYARKAEDHVWIQNIPKAGKEKNFLVPIEVEGGISIVRVPDSKGKVTPSSATHILGEDGEFLADYPPGKTRFVQTTVTKLTYYEGDAEPLSNISDRPIISGQLIANLNDGVATASAEAMRKSMEGSGVGIKKFGAMFWLYIIGIAGVGISIGILIVVMKESEVVKQLATTIRQALGLGTGVK